MFVLYIGYLGFQSRNFSHIKLRLDPIRHTRRGYSMAYISTAVAPIAANALAPHTSPRFILYSHLSFICYTLYSTLYTSHCRPSSLNFTLDISQSRIHTPHSAMFTALPTLHPTLHTAILYTPNFAFSSPHFTLFLRYFTL